MERRYLIGTWGINHLERLITTRTLVDTVREVRDEWIQLVYGCVRLGSVNVCVKLFIGIGEYYSFRWLWRFEIGRTEKGMLVVIQNYVEWESIWIVCGELKMLFWFNKLLVMVVWEPTLDSCWTRKLQSSRLMIQAWLEFCRGYDIDELVVKGG
jgi:hypothetical protein